MQQCTWASLSLMTIGSAGNLFCILIFLRRRFRSSNLTPFFIALLISDCIYLSFRILKLFYYQETLFQQGLFGASCSFSFLINAYGYLTQFTPQWLLPLFHYELYIRFSLILMSFLTIQRAYDIYRSSMHFVQRNSTSQFGSISLIVQAFLVAYLLEFFGLSIYCSKTFSSTLALKWQNYLFEHLPNETTHWIDYLNNQSTENFQIDCLKYKENNCSKEQQAEAAAHYFDLHERTVVYLIREIVKKISGVKIGRNELRIKYHYHQCLFPWKTDTFLRFYDFLYSRTFDWNRYTMILVFGSIIPSLLTIIGNAFSLHLILHVRTSIHRRSSLSQKRIDETRRVILIITIECLFAVCNSWLIDLILSMKYCRRSIAISDECPDFLLRFHQYLILFDLFNSISNLLLYCIAGRRFRYECRQLFRLCYNRGRDNSTDPLFIHLKLSKRQQMNSDDEHGCAQSSSLTGQSTFSKRHVNRFYEYIKLRPVTIPTSVD